jgi:hypothetical protein
MATVKHPIQGRPTLAWSNDGSVWTAYTEASAKYKRGNAYAVREVFALLRPLYNGHWAFTDGKYGWVVTRNSFDEIREFSNFYDAELYIKSLFALEYGA